MMILTMMKMRRYVDSYCNNPDQLNLSAQEMLKPAVEVFSNPPLFIPFHIFISSFKIFIQPAREARGPEGPAR